MDKVTRYGRRRFTVVAALVIFTLLAVFLLLELRRTNIPTTQVVPTIADESLPPVHPIFGTAHKTVGVDSFNPAQRPPTVLKAWLYEKLGLRIQYVPSPPPNRSNLRLGQSDLEWSSGGYLYFCASNTTQPLWELASCSKMNLSEVTSQDFSARFVSSGDKFNGRAVFGTNWLGHAIRVKQGQVILARLASDPTQVYVLEIAKQNQTNAVVYFIKSPL